jgi:hypothetical protein
MKKLVALERLRFSELPLALAPMAGKGASNGLDEAYALPHLNHHTNRIHLPKGTGYK